MAVSRSAVSGDGSVSVYEFTPMTFISPDSIRARRSECDATSSPAKATKASMSNAGVQTKITFERRFTPGAMPASKSLEPGDTLIGGLMMMVAFDQNGAVRGCSVLAETGEARPDYGCDEVRAERFQASVGGASQNSQLGVLTVLVYGHEEEVV